jgi:excisionase family DNA binding protein
MADLQIKEAERLAYTIDETAALLGCSVRAVERAIESGALPTLAALAPRKLVAAAALDYLVERSVSAA